MQSHAASQPRLQQVLAGLRGAGRRQRPRQRPAAAGPAAGSPAAAGTPAPAARLPLAAGRPRPAGAGAGGVQRGPLPLLPSSGKRLPWGKGGAEAFRLREGRGAGVLGWEPPAALRVCSLTLLVEVHKCTCVAVLESHCKQNTLSQHPYILKSSVPTPFTLSPPSGPCPDRFVSALRTLPREDNQSFRTIKTTFLLLPLFKKKKKKT